MGYVVYDTVTTRIVPSKAGRSVWKSEAAAKAAVTRAAKAGVTTLAAIEADSYYSEVEKMVVRTNLLSGKEYMESVNTPSYCSPSSEAYWSM